MAQLVERILGKDEVTSSTLVSSSKKKPHCRTLYGLHNAVFCVVLLERNDNSQFIRGEKRKFQPNRQHLSSDLHDKDFLLGVHWLF